MSNSHAGHHHSHTPTITGDNERKVLIAFAITFTFMIVEVAGGLLSGSLALIADAGHMLTDAAALALAYVAFRIGKRSADKHRTFGYHRFEVVAGLMNALSLFGIVIWIAYEAIKRFQEPEPVLAGPMFVVAAIGLLVNVVVLWILTRGDTDHVNIKGASLHVLGDLLGSVGAIAAAITIYFTGWTPIDPILSLVVSLLILRSAWALLRQSLHILLEGAPDNVTPNAIEQHLLASVTGLAAVNHVHVWLITSGRALATLHVRPFKDVEPRLLVAAVEAELSRRFDIKHATIALDWPDEASDACSLGTLAFDHSHNDHAGHDHIGHDHRELERSHDGHTH